MLRARTTIDLTPTRTVGVGLQVARTVAKPTTHLEFLVLTSRNSSGPLLDCFTYFVMSAFLVHRQSSVRPKCDNSLPILYQLNRELIIRCDKGFKFCVKLEKNSEERCFELFVFNLRPSSEFPQERRQELLDATCFESFPRLQGVHCEFSQLAFSGGLTNRFSLLCIFVEFEFPTRQLPGNHSAAQPPTRSLRKLRILRRVERKLRILRKDLRKLRILRRVERIS